MNSDAASEEESFASSLEDFFAGKPADGPAQGEAGIIAPPAPEDGAAVEQIVANIRAELTHQVRSEATAVLPADMTVRAHGNVGEFAYRPDVIVDADLPPPEVTSARNPLVVVEVAAAGSERGAFIEQWQIYRSLPTLSIYVLVDAARVGVTVYRRSGQTWKTETYEDADDQFLLPPIHGLLSLKTIYTEVFPDEEGEEEG